MTWADWYAFMQAWVYPVMLFLPMAVGFALGWYARNLYGPGHRPLFRIGRRRR